jgi:hypothetical protein
MNDLEFGFDQWVIRYGEGQPRNDRVRERFAENIDTGSRNCRHRKGRSGAPVQRQRAFDAPLLLATGHAEVLVRQAPLELNILNFPSL